jgi:hypothetical protein
MNDNDLERQLRAQHGPREEGYTPTRLPMSLEEARTRTAGPSPLMRTALFAGAAVAGVLAVAVAAAVLSGPGYRGVGGTNDESPSPSASAPWSPVACVPVDVTMTAEPWGGAAGSRGTVVTFSIADGRLPCLLDLSEPTAEVRDANGTVLVRSASAGGSHPMLLAPGESFTAGVEWSNWCAGVPAAPLSLYLAVADDGWPAPVLVEVPSGDLDPVPPCMGSNAPSSLSVTELQPAQ